MVTLTILLTILKIIASILSIIHTSRKVTRWFQRKNRKQKPTDL